MKWYDLIAPVYDLSCQWTYRRARRESVAQLRLSEGETVLDLVCGTGQNFPYINDKTGESGKVIGLDVSTGMLKRAQKRVEKAGWQNVHLVQADARFLTHGLITSILDEKEVCIDSVICSLGFSVVPDWEKVFHRSFDLLTDGGRFVIMDWNVERVHLGYRFVDLIARSDISRRTWEPLEKDCSDFGIAKDYLWGRVFVASGTK